MAAAAAALLCVLVLAAVRPGSGRNRKTSAVGEAAAPLAPDAAVSPTDKGAARRARRGVSGVEIRSDSQMLSLEILRDASFFAFWLYPAMCGVAMYAFSTNL